MIWTKLNSIKLTNFRGFEGEHFVDFPSSGLVLIKGLNKDTGGGSASGKSSFLHAIQYPMDGSPFPATTHQSWYTKKKPKVEICLEKLDQEIVFSKKSLSINGKDIEGGTKVIKERFFHEIGLEPELLKLITYRSQKKPGLFFSMDDSQKKGFLTKVLDLHKYEEAAEKAAEAAKGLEREAEQLEAQLGVLLEEQQAAQYEELAMGPIEPLKKKIEQLNAQADELRVKKEEVLKRKQAAIDELTQAAIKEVSDLKTTLPEEFWEVDEKLSKCRKKIALVDEENRKREQEREQTIKELTEKGLRLVRGVRTVETIKREFKQRKEEYLELEKEICFTCKQNWSSPDLTEEKERLKATLTALKEEVEDTKNILAQHKEIQEKIDSIPQAQKHELTEKLAKAEKDLQKKKNAFLGQQEQAERELDSKKAKIFDKLEIEKQRLCEKFSINQIEQEIQTIIKVVNDLRDRIESEQSERAIYESKKALKERIDKKVQEQKILLEKKQKELSLEKDVHAAVGRKGFLGLIFDQVLEEAAAVSNSYLARVANTREVTLRYSMEKESKTGQSQRRIIPIVTFKGMEVPFKSGLSGGMQTAVELAADLGLGEVVAKRRGAFPGWLILDESFDGLGAIEKESCMEMLQIAGAERLVLVVDHASEFQGMFQKIINIESLDGRSKIV